MNTKPITLTGFESLIPKFSGMFPEMHRSFYPRKLRLPSGYYRPDLLPLVAVDFLLDVQSKGDAQALDNGATIAGVLALLQSHRCPTYFVSPELSDAMVRTAPPESMLFREVQWPFPAIQFVLNKKWSVEHFGHHITTLIIGRPEPGSTLEVKSNKATVPSFKVVMPSIKVGLLMYHVASPEDQCMGCCSERFLMEHTIESQATCEARVIGDLQWDKIIAMRKSLMQFVVSCLLIMSEVPDLVDSERVIIPGRSTGKGQTKRVIEPALWEPRWLGKNYVHPHEHGGGHHASPETHWRRGHWRRQAHGKGRLDRRLTWIKPMLVNAPE